MVEPTLRQAILDKIDELRTLATALPSEPPPDPPPEPDPDPDPEVIENPPTAATTQAGLWSDPATFGFVRPGPDTHLTITHDVELDSGTAKSVDLRARLKWLDNGTLDLHGSLVAWSGGIVEGTTGRLSFHVPDDRLFIGNTEPGPLEDEPDFHPADIGLWVMMGGNLLIRAPEITPYVRASQKGLDPESLEFGCSSSVAISEGSATLAEEPEGWQVGDTLLLAGERGQFKTATLDSIDGSAIAYTERDDGLPFDFEASCMLFEDEEQWAPVVANLSRRFVIDSPLVQFGDTHHRAHIAIGHHAHCHLQYVEVRNLGPRGKLGRYPIHFHHAHAHHLDDVAGCSVWQALRAQEDGSHRGNRGIVIHQTQGVLIQDNVVLHSRGHAIFMEEQEELDNHVLRNLVVDARGREEIAIVDLTTGVYWGGAHGFWLRAGNTIEDNVAIGCDVGMVLLSQRDGSGAKVAGYSTDVIGQEAIGCSINGIWSNIQAQWTRPVLIRNHFGGFITGNLLNAEGTFFDAIALLNGVDSQFRQQFMLYTGKHMPHIFRGGTIAGPGAVRTYGGKRATLEGVRIHSNYLVIGAQGVFGIEATDCHITADAICGDADTTPPDPFGARHIAVVHLVNASGVVAGRELAGITQDVSRHFMPQDDTWGGGDIAGDRWLANPLPQGGIIVQAFTHKAESGSELRKPGESDYYHVTIPTDGALARGILETRGYPTAVPPGDYELTVYRPSGAKEVWRITVEPGKAKRFTEGELIAGE